MTLRDIPEVFHVAFSFAGAQRALVERLCVAIEHRLGTGTVFYDEWFSHELNGRGADLRLQAIYSSRCRMVVACLSEEYGLATWTSIEHESIRARYMQATSEADRKALTLIRVGDGDVQGILQNAIWEDARTNFDKSVEVIIARLRSIDPDLVPTTTGGLPLSSAWPDLPPQVVWPIANHDQARLEFATLVTATSPFRILQVLGDTQTGKSTMSRQMMLFGFELDGVHCGRLDFKGSGGLRNEIFHLAYDLEVDEPQGADDGELLRKVHDMVLRRGTPTLLIIDSYEAAGVHADWIERRVLLDCRRHPWLRVVLLGQPPFTSPIGQPWSTVACAPIVLTPPEPADWFAATQANSPEPDVSLAFIEEAHRRSAGNGGFLAFVLKLPKG